MNDFNQLGLDLSNLYDDDYPAIGNGRDGIIRISAPIDDYPVNNNGNGFIPNVPVIQEPQIVPVVPANSTNPVQPVGTVQPTTTTTPTTAPPSTSPIPTITTVAVTPNVNVVPVSQGFEIDLKTGLIIGGCVLGLILVLKK